MDSDLMLVFGGMGIMIVIAAIVALFECVGKCSHKWESWAFMEDSAAFFQKRQCSKCGYTQFEQVRKVVEKKDGL
jgi:hypothetical protein